MIIILYGRATDYDFMVGAFESKEAFANYFNYISEQGNLYVDVSKFLIEGWEGRKIELPKIYLEDVVNLPSFNLKNGKPITL